MRSGEPLVRLRRKIMRAGGIALLDSFLRGGDADDRAVK
jgi:hypothetical protein